MDHRLRKNSQFSYIYKKGEKVFTDNFALFVVKSKYESYKIGFSISKKLGKAHQRNLLKRRMREITKLYIHIPSFCNYVVVARENASKISFEELKAELIKLFGKYESKKHN